MFDIELSKKQEYYHEMFVSAVVNRDNVFISSDKRNWGKTIILNELGYTLQALGYKVYILTISNLMEYCADEFIIFYPEKFEGKLNDKSVVLVDEVYYYNPNFQNFTDYSLSRNTPIVGFVNYKELKIEKDKDSVENFKREYECNWVFEK